MDITISRTKRPYEFNMKASHYHDYYELFYLQSGNCRIFINHTLYYVEPGDMILLPPGQIHRTTYHKSPVSERVTVNFGGDYLGDMIKICGNEETNKLFERPKVTVTGSRKSYVESLIQRMEREAAGVDPYSPLLKRGYLYELLIFLSRFQNPVVSREKLPVAEAAVEEAAQYLYKHYREPITLEEVAGRIHMSPAYFSRKFKAVTGMGYKEYLTNLRIREASGLLLNTSKTVTVIALECGFGDGNYFGDAFKKIMGMSPREYRKSSSIEFRFSQDE